MEPTDHPQPDSPEAGRARNSDLSKILLERRRKDRPSHRIPRRAPGALTPLSYAQEQIWFLEQLVPGGSSYHIARAFTLEGPLDLLALTRSLDAVVARHEALRTSFAIVAGQSAGQSAGQPVQAVAPALALAIPVLDLRVVPEPARGEEARRLGRAEVLRPFDLARGPVVRLTLLRLADERSVLLLTLHHIAADGWSLGILLRELGDLYRSFAGGAEPPLQTLPPLAIQYADFALWQRERLAGGVLEKLLAFWRTQLEGAPPVLALPTDRPRPAIQSFRGAGVRRVLPRELAARLRSFGERERASPFMALLAAFQALLVRHTGQEDLVVGSPVAGRSRSELEGLIGPFLNMLVLRTSLASDPGFRELVGRVREVTLSAHAHQEMPFEKLVVELAPERARGHAPLFQVIFLLQSAAWEKLDLPGLALAPREIKREETKVDLTFAIHETGGGLALALQYNRDLFDGTTMARFAAQYEELLSAALAEPDRPLSELPVSLPAERHQVLHEWNDSAAAYAPDLCLHELIARQVARTPDAPALVFEGESLTYAETDRRANHLAWRLRGLGVGPEVRVAVAVERSLELPLALLAVLKAGGAYVPLDPSYPQERLDYMLSDSRAAVHLTRERVLELLGRGESDEAPESGVRPENLAYVIYTSGSTGRPKGAMNSHRGIVNRLQWMQAAYGLDTSDRVLQKTPASFDVSVWELFWPLLTGACLVVAKPGGHQDSAYLVDLIQRERVTTMHFVPSMLQVFVEQRGVEQCTSLRRVVCSGEALPADLARRLFERVDVTELHNLYGPTEAAVDVTYQACRRGDRIVPIGRPIANLSIHIVDRSFRPVPLGVPGELLIGGVGVGRGYLDRLDLTAERFVPGEGERLYRTGDLARFFGDGRIEFLGRIDHQVKVRGFRIELQEIEAALMAEPEVREAAVVVRHEASDQAGDRRLVAFVVGTDADLKERLRARLPEYMVPAAIVYLEALPLSPSGKVDRGALSQLGVLWSSAPEHVAPRTALEDELARMWSASLGLEEVGVHDNFFELGGNSITGAILINRLQERLGEIVHVVAIFDAPTVAGLATWLGSQCPEAVERIWGRGSLPGEANLERRRVLGPAEAAAFRELIEPLAPVALSGKNPRAVFLLSPPRSGSTLLRVMLAGHPGLFAPPELELLSFNTMAERREAFSGRDSFWLEGAIRAVMEIRGEGPEKAREWVVRSEREGWTTQRFYRELQELLDGRMLVDKTPSYALDPSVLQRAEESFEEPLYIHLLRHPYGMISSFEEAKLDQVFFRRPHSYARRELAELVWRVSHENVTELLAEIPAERHRAVYFEDLVREPEETLRDLCGFLGLDFDPAMAAPYQGKRMTDGLYAESRMLGDVKFHQHQGVEASAAERWRKRYREDFLAPETWAVATAFGYEERSSHAFQPIAPAEWDGVSPLPLSFAQERLWFLDQLEPGSAFYNIPVAVRLDGALDVAALQRSFDEIVRRHRVLRTRFAVVEGAPVQVVAPELSLPLHVVDLTGLPEALREEETRRLANAEARLPFDLGRGPLIRTTLLRLGNEAHALLLSMHHIVSDGWSMGVLLQELSQASPLPELPIQYADFAVWQRGRLSGEALEAELAWWRERLAGAPALLELPTDRPRPAVQSFRGGKVEVALPAELSSQLSALSRKSGATLFMSLLAGFNALLARLTGQPDIVVGSPIAGRDRGELENLIGFFVNTLVLRTDLSGDPGFAGILERVRESAVGAYAHQELPFEKLVGELAPVRTLAHAPLFQVMLVLQNAPRRPLRLGDARASALPTQGVTAKFDLILSLVERGGRLTGAFQFNSDLFDAATIARLAGCFQMLVEGAVANPAARLSDLPLLSAAARAQLLREWNDTAADPGAFRSLPERIAVQAARKPGAPAVLCGSESLTYAELNRRANRLAWHLRSLGVVPETRVAIAMERSPDLLVALLGVLKAGGAYVPIDPSYPEERRAWMLADSGATVVLDGSFPAAAGQGEAEAPPLVLAPGNLAYVLYTSGSTGRPKGVQVPHGALVNFLDSLRREPGLDEEDTLLAVTTLSFDIAGLELFLPLLVGARVAPASREEAQDGARLAALIESSGATVLQATPATWQMLLDSGWPGGGRLRAFCGGEALPRDLAERLLPRTAALWNLYGPTEATIWCSAERVLPEEGRISIGRPIANTRLHVLDADLNLAPLGAAGELAIGGEGLARGYAGRSDLTAERFVPDPFGRGERLYRTGDLSRALPDGRLEVLGRIDHQVKVRGFRIELQEIEAALVRHPDVREAVVLATAGRLVAFVVANAGREIGSAALRSFAGGFLPEYMVPSSVVPLPAFPLTPNGKVDRKALAGLSTPVFSKGTAAPRSPVEEVAVEIWREVLKLPAVGIDDDFFELGGHSLLATQVVSRAREAFGIDLPVRSLFETKTLSGWAEQVDRALRAAQGAMAPPIVRVPREGDLPLSFSQERQWFLDQLEPGNAGYNLPLALRLDGRLDVAAFAAALAGIVERHESLRTAFPSLLGRPVQAIAPAAPVPMPLVDLSGLPDGLLRPESERLAAAEARRPFDLARGPLFRTGLLRLGTPEKPGHVALLTAHHSVTDGWSTGILLRELAALYGAACLGRLSPLPELPVQYADFAIWQRRWLVGEALESELGYWRQRLAGTPMLFLPLDRPRPAVQSFRGGRVSFEVPAALAQEVRGESRRLRSSLFMTLLGAWSALLARLSGQDDFAVGTYIANRNRAEVEGLIGFFVNNLALRTSLSGDPVFEEIARRVRETTLAAYAHQDVPFEKVLEAVQPERDLSHTPVFQVMLVLQNVPERAFELPGLTWKLLGKDRQRSEFDLTLWLSEDREGGLKASLEFDQALFDRATVVRLAERFRRLLTGAARQPGERLSRLPLLSEAERHQLAREWCDTASDHLAGSFVHELIEAQAARAPHALALISGERRMTYGELDARASRLARRLAALGVGPEVLVGLAVERSPEMIVGILAALKAGGAYLPLDPHLPRERFELILEDARPAVVLTEARWAEMLPPGLPSLLFGTEEGLPEAPVRPPAPGNLAYVLYTSGSTGRPKGVMVHHHAMASYALSAGEDFGLTAADRMLQFATLTFDTSAEEIFTCLSRGATLVLRNEEMLGSVSQFLATCGAWGITVLDLPTAYWHEIAARLAEGEGELPAALRLVIIAGEKALAERLAAWKRHAGERVRLVNTYGPTEGTIVVTSADLVGTPAEVPIGRPIVNASVHLLDAALEAVPAGVPGELAIGGIGVTRGYLGRPDLTAESFIPDPFATEPGARLYRTGDRTRFLPDGTLEFHGRIDHQVKIRGFRVEPGEVEAALVRHPAVRETVVVAREDTPGDLRLIAYLVLGGEPPAPPETPAPSAPERALTMRPAPRVLELRPTVMLPRLVPVHAPAPPAESLVPADLPPLDEALRQRVLVEWNRTESGFPKDSTLHGLVDAQAGRTPEAVALCWRGQRLTYGELMGRADRLAGHLRRLGVGPEVPVGVCFDRCAGMIVALLGTLRAGGLYVPLDPAYPRDRLAFTLEDSQVRLVLTQEHLLGLLPSAVEPLVLDEQGEGSFQEGHGAEAEAANLAYLIYTSGSTGRPKGVAITHRSATTLLHWARGHYGPEDLAGVLASTSICFDLSIFELFLPLAWGGTVHLAQNALELPQLPTATEVTLVNTVPSAIAELVRTASVPASVRTVCLAGEPLRGALVRRIYGLETVEGVWNLYGPSEDTTYSTFTRIARDVAGEPTIGRPIADTRAYLLGPDLEPVPVGASGELYLGGDGLARGYLGRPDLTAERFVPDPFVGPGFRLYRTGDLARYRDDGEIEFLGRIDHQVKVRGFRIELGEIEAQLLAHPAVRDAVAVVREKAGDPRIVAYVVLQGEADLRAHMREKLPEHMVPSSFVALAALPLTPNGKVDRRALPEPDWKGGEAAPRNAAEARLAEIWREVLGIERVGVDDDFFDLGGHSMSGTQILSRVRDAFGVTLPLKTLFAEPTIARLVARLGEEGTGPESLPPLGPAPRAGDAELSFLQEAMWFLDRMAPGSAYNIPMALRFRGPLDRAALARSLAALAARHEALRTILVDRGRGPVQAVIPQVSAALPLVDLRAASAAEIVRLAAEEACRPFDLRSQAPLFRCTLLRPAESEHLLLLTLHHAVADGWSVSVLLHELMALCCGLPLPDLPLQFADFAAWQRRIARSPEIEPQLAWWRKRLAGGPEPLELPTDRPRPPVQTTAGGWQPLIVPARVRAELWRLARRRGATPVAALLAVYQALLGRFTGQEDFAIGSPVANRNRVETEGLVGCLTNSLVFRSDLASGPSAILLLERVAETVFGAFAHQDVPFERLLEELPAERDLSRPPVFQAMLVFQNLTRSVPCPPGLDVELLEAPNGGAKVDLLLALSEAPAGLAGGFEYNRDLFDRTTLDRIARCFLALLEGFVGDPERPVSELPLLGAAERHQLVLEWNDTLSPWKAGDSCLHDLVAAQARRTPEAVAAVCAGREITYRELDGRANQLARRLLSLGVGPDILVGICLERSIEMVVGLLGILKAGGAYLPLDPTYPAERLALMLDEAEVRVLITQGELVSALPSGKADVLRIDLLEGEISEAPPSGATAGNLAYVMYTSGSTGRPKGVAIPHRGVLRLVLGATYARLDASETVLQLAPVSFDASTLEIWGPLLNGGRIAILPPGTPSLQELGRALESHGVTTAWLTAGLFHQMVDEAPEALAGLRQLLAGGDVLSVPHVRRLLQAASGLTLINGYGPTESTTFTCCHPMRDPGSVGPSVPIGRPIGNTRVVLLGRDGEPVSAGVAGELCIGGDGLARGYFRRPDLTGERFVPDGVGSVPGERLYRTGDLARWRRDGTVEFLGRIDQQVKIRGFRIEPGEVESALAACPGVRACAVAALEDPASGAAPGDKRLVAYAVAEEGAELDAAGLRALLVGKLPSWMVPSAFVILPALPLTPNGKVDRRALPPPAWAPEWRSGEGEDVEPRDAVEELLAGVWSELLGVPRVGAFDNFFDLGGHSLVATRLASRVRDIFKVEMPPQRIFERPTFAALADFIRSAAEDTSPVPPLRRVPRGDDLPASFGQERLWFLDRLHPGSPAYNVAGAFRLTGRLDVPALAAALDAIVRRHETLRTTFAERSGLVQVVAEHRSTDLPVVDLQGLPDAHGTAVALAREEANRPFDLERGPLVRFTLIRIGELDSAFLVTLHHIVFDGWSMQVFFRELAALYGGGGLPELPVQYADYADWQRRWLSGEVLEAELAFWRERLAGAPALLDLPTDRPRPAVQSLRGGLLPLTVPAGIAGKVKELSRRSGATLFMTLLAAFQALLARFSGEERIPVGTPVAGRTRPEIENLIGFFVNTLVLSTDLSGDPSFEEAVERVRAMALGAYAHQELPLDLLVAELRPERTASHAPLFQVMFVVQNAPRAGRSLPGLALGPLATERKAEVDGQTSKFDITLSLTEAPDGSLLGRWEYSRDLFDEATVRQLDANFLRLVESAVGDPGRRLSQVDLLWDGERHQVRAAVDPLAGIDLRGFLRARLPEPMIPWAFVVLPALPLTPSGKVDRRALPAPEPTRGGDGGAFVPPRTEMEELVAAVWAQVLGIERIGAFDRFFDIGGQSLLATQVVSRLRRELGLEIPLRTLFEEPTLEGFSYALEDLLLLEEPA